MAPPIIVARTAAQNAFDHKGWRFENKTGPILSTSERKTFTEQLASDCAPLTVPALPEAVFGGNWLTITHECGQTFNFDAKGAISCWVRQSADKGSDGIRTQQASLASWKKVEQTIGGTEDYDWTFSTDYSGDTSSFKKNPVSIETSCATNASGARGAREVISPGGGKPSASAGAEKPSFIESSCATKLEYDAWTPEASPWTAHKGSGFEPHMSLLRRRDVPILHYVDLPLYEDDMGDNGDSVMRVRVRVMPTCFLVLLRHALRVDGVLIRHYDTRIFHKFGTSIVLRDRRLGEAPLVPLRAGDEPDVLGRSASMPNEQEAAEKLAMRPPKSEIIEELLL